MRSTAQKTQNIRIEVAKIAEELSQIRVEIMKVLEGIEDDRTCEKNKKNNQSIR